MATELISLGILFLCAIIGGIISTRLRQPAVVGLLVVGAIIGPYALNLVRDENIIRVMAEFGAILLLFIVGLEFDVSKLMKIGARAIIIGFSKFAIVLFAGYEATLLLGFSSTVALFVGVLLSFSSTVVIVKVLEQKEMFRRKEVPLLIAILILEDVFAVLTLTFFSGIEQAGASLISTFERIIFSIAILILAYYVMMKLLKYGVNIIQKNTSDDSMLAFLSLAIGALFSYFAFYLGLTPSAGAFLAGSLIASLPNAKEYGKAVHPYALIFTSIFFISMGTLVNFRAIQPNIMLIAVLILVIVITRFVAIGFLTFMLTNFRHEEPFFASIAMMSIGEFSLLIAKESEKFAFGVDLVTITAVVIFLTTLLMSAGINYSGKFHAALKPRMPVRARIRLERVSEYMRRYFDQMEIENFFTKKLGAESRFALVISVVALLAFFMLRRVSLMIKGTAMIYSFFIVSIVLMAYILSLLLKRLRAIYSTLSVILTNVDASRNLKKCRTILKNLLLALVFFSAAMLFPFVIFALKMAPWANIIPVVLCMAALYHIKSFMMLVDSSRYFVPTYTPSASAAKF